MKTACFSRPRNRWSLFLVWWHSKKWWRRIWFISYISDSCCYHFRNCDGTESALCNFVTPSNMHIVKHLRVVVDRLRLLFCICPSGGWPWTETLSCSIFYKYFNRVKTHVNNKKIKLWKPWYWIHLKDFCVYSFNLFTKGWGKRVKSFHTSYTAVYEWTQTLCVPDQIAHHLHSSVWMNLNPLSTRSDWSSFTQLCVNGPKPSVYQIRLVIIYTALCEWTLNPLSTRSDCSSFTQLGLNEP